MEKIILNCESWYGLRSYLSAIMHQNSVIHYRAFKVKETYNKLIYHYTTIDSFKAIMKSQCIHATNISYVNDSAELNYAQTLFINHITSFLKKSKKPIEREILKKLLSRFEYIEKSNRFISCFSINGDLKHQWDHYADNGNGLSVGFNFVNLKETLDPSSWYCHVVYDLKEQNKLIEYLIKTLLKFFIEKIDWFDWNTYDPAFLISTEIFEYCEFFLCNFKDEEYSKEKEFRLEIKTDFLSNFRSFNINHKEKEGVKIPYIENKTDFQRKLEKKITKEEYEYEYNVEFEYQMKKLPIEEIIIGFNLDFEMTKNQLNEILINHNYKDVIIKKSESF